MIPCVLSIGHSDSSGGSGVQADLRIAQALGCHAFTAVAAITVQNASGIKFVEPLRPDLVARQMETVLEDVTPHAIKTGMLGSAGVINAVGDLLDRLQARRLPVVVDPVMEGYGGWSFLDKEARDALKRRLLIHATILTPNLQEASDLTGLAVRDVETMAHAAEMLLTLGPRYVLIKGGSLGGETVQEVLAGDEGIEMFRHPRAHTHATHGASSLLSGGLTAGLAQGLGVREAYLQASACVHEALHSERRLSAGKGPVILPRNETSRPAVLPNQVVHEGCL